MAVDIEGQTVQRIANMLYQMPAPLRDQRQDDVRQRPGPGVGLERLAPTFFSKDPTAMNLGRGQRHARLPADHRSNGTFTPDRLRDRADLRRRHHGAPPSTPKCRSRRPGQRCEPGTEGCVEPCRTACRRPRCSTCGPPPGCGSPTCRRAPRYSSPSLSLGGPDQREVQVRFVNERQDQDDFRFAGRDQGDHPVTRHRPGHGSREAATTRRSRWRGWTSTWPRARSSASWVPTVPARRRRCGSSRRCSSRSG